MSEQKEGQASRPWAVVVSSFDDSCDLWPLFFHYFFKHWPDCPLPVYLVSNYRRYDDPRVISLCVGQDVSWGDTTRKALEAVTADYVWLLLDDLYLDRDIDTARIDEAVANLARLKGMYLETGRQSDMGEPVEGTDLRRIPVENPRAGLNSAFYSRDLLLELAKPGVDPWQANTAMNKYNRDGCPDLYYLREGVPPLISFVEAVKGKFWKPVGMEYLKETGMKTDLWWRPYPPQGQDPFCKTIRSFHKRRMEMRKKRHERQFAAGKEPDVIKPIT